MLNKFFLIWTFCGMTLITFSQNNAPPKNLDPLKYFSLGDSIVKFIPFLKCVEQSLTNEIITIDRIAFCHAFKFSLESDSFLVDNINFPSIDLLTDSNNLINTISIVKTYLRTKEKHPKQNAREEFKKLEKYFMNSLSANDDEYSRPKSSEEKGIIFTKSNIQYLLRLVEIKQKRPVAAILEIVISKM